MRGDGFGRGDDPLLPDGPHPRRSQISAVFRARLVLLVKGDAAPRSVESASALATIKGPISAARAGVSRFRGPEIDKAPASPSELKTGAAMTAISGSLSPKDANGNSAYRC